MELYNLDLIPTYVRKDSVHGGWEYGIIKSHGIGRDEFVIKGRHENIDMANRLAYDLMNGRRTHLKVVGE